MKTKRFLDKKQHRLKGFDYSQDGCYFVTTKTKDREHYFGEIVNDKMEMSKIGQEAHKFWLEIPEHFPFVILDEFVVMPNHIHGIIIINKNNSITDNLITVGTQNLVFPLSDFCDLEEYTNKMGSQSQNLSSIVRGFKIGVTKFAKKNKFNFQWQSRFHDRIIRHIDELDTVRNYIINNPLNWTEDSKNDLSTKPLIYF
jgi:putative transposase